MKRTLVITIVAAIVMASLGARSAGASGQSSREMSDSQSVERSAPSQSSPSANDIATPTAPVPPPPPPPSPTPPNGGGYGIERTLSDEAQRKTIAFDALGFLTGNLGAQSFLPPGKVADFSGFQYLRDNDPTNMGHNTDFVTIVAFNVLHILTQDQISQLVAGAQSQVDLINQYAYERFPLMKAFRRLSEGDLPQGSTGLDKSAVMAYSGELGRINGQISYDRAQLLGGIIRSLSLEQQASFAQLKALNGVGNWNRTLSDPLEPLHLSHDVNVAVMTYASEMYSWYEGSVEADVYFCPEGEGTYFGSFYLKDWPAMGNPNYTINEQLTAEAGEDFLATLADSQAALVTNLVDIQRSDLNEIVERRQDISIQLRRFMTGDSVDSAAVLDLAERYGELDGEIVYNYATHFAEVGHSLSSGQQEQLAALADSLGYIPATGAFLYSQPIDMPEIMNTDFLFGVSTETTPTPTPGASVGGIAELPALSGTSAGEAAAPAEGSGWSARYSVALVGGLATAIVALTAASAWYARRRRLH